MKEPREIPITLAHLRRRRRRKKIIIMLRLGLERGERSDKLLVQARRQDFHSSLFSHAVFTGSGKVLVAATLGSTVLCARELSACRECRLSNLLTLSVGWTRGLVSVIVRGTAVGRSTPQQSQCSWTIILEKKNKHIKYI